MSVGRIHGTNASRYNTSAIQLLLVDQLHPQFLRTFLDQQVLNTNCSLLCERCAVA